MAIGVHTDCTTPALVNFGSEKLKRTPSVCSLITRSAGKGSRLALRDPASLALRNAFSLTPPAMPARNPPAGGRGGTADDGGEDDGAGGTADADDDDDDDGVGTRPVFWKTCFTCTASNAGGTASCVALIRSCACRISE